MPKKKMLLPQHFYNAAELVKGHRWYVKYYQTNPKTGEKERFRETFNLNRVRDLEERERLALSYINSINARLPLGFPFEKTFDELPTSANIVDAITLVVDKLMSSDRENTNRNFRSMRNIFLEWLRSEGLDRIAIGDFRKKHAVAFLDYAVWDRDISNRTYNNYLERLTAIFKEAKKREYISKNYWKKFETKRAGKKKRRAFTKEERELVANYIAQKDKWLALGILLQYHCFIRPVEMRRLRFNMVDIDAGLIYLSSEETKNRDSDIVTIPNDFIPFLRSFGFEKYPPNYLIFGKNGLPHKNIPCAHDTLNSRHRVILQKLFDKGILSNITNLSFYSWKDTGAQELFRRKVNILEIMRQLRHKDLATTQKYCNSLYVVNAEIKALDNQLIKI